MNKDIIVSASIKGQSLGRLLAGSAGALSLAALIVSGCVAGSAESDPGDEDNARESSAVSSSSGPRYEAENRDAQSGCVQASSHLGFSGSGYMDFGNQGSYLQWNSVKGPSAAKYPKGAQYTFTFRYANGGSKDRPVTLRVNDVDVGTVAFTPTGSWDTWGEQKIIATVKADSTSNKVRITASTSEGGPNIDYVEVKPTRGAFYYPWYPATWSVDGHHVFYHPDLGYYNSSDDVAVDRHIADMKYAKIDMAVSSWWGPNSDANSPDGRFQKLLDRTKAARTGLQWAVYYEDEGFGNPSVSTLQADLNYLMNTKKYTSHPNYARVGTKPVIFVYNADDNSCEVAKRWAQAANGKWHVVLKVFGNFASCSPQPNGWHQYGPNTRESEHVGYHFSISPGFWRADMASPTLKRDLSAWKLNVRHMVASGEPWQMVTTFNEWGEGTAVEPASEWKSSSGYGGYLDALHNDGL